MRKVFQLQRLFKASEMWCLVTAAPWKHRAIGITIELWERAHPTAHRDALLAQAFAADPPFLEILLRLINHFCESGQQGAVQTWNSYFCLITPPLSVPSLVKWLEAPETLMALDACLGIACNTISFWEMSQKAIIFTCKNCLAQKQWRWERRKISCAHLLPKYSSWNCHLWQTLNREQAQSASHLPLHKSIFANWLSGGATPYQQLFSEAGLLLFAGLGIS